MSIHKSVTPSTTNQYNRVHGDKNLAVYLLRLLYHHIPLDRKSLFLHGKGPLYQIFLWRLSHHRNQSWPLLFRILSFLLTFLCQCLDQNSVFTNIFHLWYISSLNICGEFVNVTRRVILPLIFLWKKSKPYWEVTGNSGRAPWNMDLKILLSLCHKLLFYYRQPIILQYFGILKYHWSILS